MYVISVIQEHQSKSRMVDVQIYKVSQVINNGLLVLFLLQPNTQKYYVTHGVE